MAQQLREAAPFGRHPKHLFIDNDCKHGSTFTRIARTTGIELVRTAFRAPKETAICLWFLGSTRRERLDHLLMLGEAHHRRILVEDGDYFNRNRPHQGLRQRIPNLPGADAPQPGPARSTPIWGGLHHASRRAA